MPGNLALCSRTASSAQSRSCLGWIDIPSTAEGTSTGIAVMGELPTTTESLNWRFEDGLLKAVGSDGFATDRCLGPSKGITSFDTSAFQPYELVLQDCPVDKSIKNQNIFSHDTFSDAQRLIDGSTSVATTRAVTFKDEDQKETQSEIQKTALDEPHHRHMRFLVGGDGRIRSLAPVFDPNSTTPKRDLVAGQQFCVTAGAANDANAYLVPCFEHEDETHIYNHDNKNNVEESSHQIFQGQQQLFEPDERSFFDSFLLDWQNSGDDETDTTDADNAQAQDIQLAYQIGYHGSLSPHQDATFDQFNSFAIRVTSEGKREDNIPAIFETTLAQDQPSGIRTYPLSTFGPCTSNSNNGQTKMGAYLLGRSTTGSVPTGMLASTSFLVYNNGTAVDDFSAPKLITSFSGQQQQQQQQQDQQQPEISSVNWPWAHFLFWGFMVCFAILVKANSIFRPSKKDPHWKQVLRESANTIDTNAATLASASDSHEHQESQHSRTQRSQSPPRMTVQHHQKRQHRRKSRRRSRTLPREIYDWDESAHSRENSSISSSTRSSLRIDVARTEAVHIDATQTTVAATECSESSCLDDTVRTDFLGLSRSDIDIDDDIDSGDEVSYDEYDDDDIEAQA